MASNRPFTDRDVWTLRRACGEFWITDPTYGATTSSADNAAAIQAAVDAAAAFGASGTKGGKIIVPPGSYTIASPIILPLAGATPENVVDFGGLDFFSCRIVGSSSFPTGRGLIETDTDAATDGTYRTYYTRIHDLNLFAPSVANVYCIWFRKSASAASDSAAWVTEVRLNNLQLLTSNQYHPSAIKFDVGCRYSHFENIYGEPGQGTTPTYATVLFDFPDGSSDNINEYGDNVGAQYSTFINCQPMVRRGGYNRFFTGRALHSTFINTFCNGARYPSQGANLRMRNSKKCIFNNFANEGLGEANQIDLDDCDQIDFNSLGIGTPDTPLSARANLTAYALGALVRDTSLSTTAADTKMYFECTTAGTSGGSTPAWDALTDGQTITDGSVTWTCRGAAVGDAIKVTNSRQIRFRGKLTAPGSTIFSTGRLVKAATTDANCIKVVFEDFDLRTASAGDASSEFTLSGTSCTAAGLTVTGTTGTPVFTAYTV